jgi:hypothetical protein
VHEQAINSTMAMARAAPAGPVTAVIPCWVYVLAEEFKDCGNLNKLSRAVWYRWADGARQLTQEECKRCASYLSETYIRAKYSNQDNELTRKLLAKVTHRRGYMMAQLRCETSFLAS